MDSMNERSAADELAAAEAELKAAQERLDAARRRMASEQPQQAAQPADASVDSQGAQSQPQPYAQAQQVSYAAQPAQPASFGSQPQPQQPTPPATAWQPDAQQAQGQPYVQQPGAQQPAQPAVWGAARLRVRAAAEPVRSAGAIRVPTALRRARGRRKGPCGGRLARAVPRLARRAQVLPGLQHLGLHRCWARAILGGILTLSVASWAIWVIAIVEGIFYLSKSQTEFEQMYVINKREWF